MKNSTKLITDWEDLSNDLFSDENNKLSTNDVKSVYFIGASLLLMEINAILKKKTKNKDKVNEIKKYLEYMRSEITNVSAENILNMISIYKK